MLDQILGLVKGQVSESLGEMNGIPADKKAAVVETTADSLVSGLKNFSTPDMLSGLLGVGGGKKPSASALNGLSGGVVKALTSKVGLSPAMAGTVASRVVPAVMALLKGKVGDSSQPGFNVGSILGALGGGAGKSGGLGGALGMLGGLFGKK